MIETVGRLFCPNGTPSSTCSFLISVKLQSTRLSVPNHVAKIDISIFEKIGVAL